LITNLILKTRPYNIRTEGLDYAIILENLITLNTGKNAQI